MNKQWPLAKLQQLQDSTYRRTIYNCRVAIETKTIEECILFDFTFYLLPFLSALVVAVVIGCYCWAFNEFY